MGASSGILTINGRDVDDLNLEVLDLGGVYGGLEYERADVRAYGSAGGWPAGEATVAPRTISLRLSLDGTVANRRARLDAVHRHLQGTLEITLEDDSTRVIYGRVERQPGTPRFPRVAWTDRTAHIDKTIEVVCYNPLWQDKTPRLVTFGTSPTQISLGTAPSPPIIRIQGAATNPEVIYRGVTGAELASMDFNGLSVAADQVLEIDMRTRRVVLEDLGASTRTDSLSDLDSGWFFALDPGDGDRGGDIHPTLEVTSGDGECHYRRYWE